jgi:V/A-type H+/Na+-transporting ATPase subunit E
MEGMDKISDGIISKVKTEAQGIIKEAEEKAQQKIAEAEKKREQNINDAKSRITEEAEAEAARITSDAKVKARQEILQAKTEVVNDIIEKAKNSIENKSGDKEKLLALVKDALPGIGSKKARLLASSKDLAGIKAAVEGDSSLADKIVSFDEYTCLGGIVLEDEEGKLRVDNTYNTRIERALQRLLPQIAKELFQESA